MAITRRLFTRFWFNLFMSECMDKPQILFDFSIQSNRAIHSATKMCENLRAYFIPFTILVYVPNWCEKECKDQIICCKRTLDPQIKAPRAGIWFKFWYILVAERITWLFDTRESRSSSTEKEPKCVFFIVSRSLLSVF